MIRSLALIVILLVVALTSGPAHAQSPEAIAEEAQAGWIETQTRLGAKHPQTLERKAIYAMALNHARQYALAEPLWRDLVRLWGGGLRPPDDPRLITLARAYLAESVLMKGPGRDGAELGRTAYEAALRDFGPDDQVITDRVRGALSKAALDQGDLDAAARWTIETVEAELRSQGPSERSAGFAGAAAVMLMQESRSREARSLMVRAEAPDGGLFSDANRLKVLEIDGNWAELAEAAAAFSVRHGSTATPSAVSEIRIADLARANALRQLAVRGQPADYDTAMALVSGAHAQLQQSGDAGGEIPVLSALSDLYLLWPGRRDPARAMEVQGRLLALTRAAFGDAHPQTWRERLDVAILQRQTGQAGPAEAGARAVIAGSDEGASARTRMLAAILVANLRAEAHDPPGAYAVLVRAGEDYMAHIREPSRRDDARASLLEFNEVYRAQVSAAWGYASRLDR